MSTKVKFYDHSDTGNAALFADLYRGKVLFDHKQQRWLLWDIADGLEREMQNGVVCGESLFDQTISLIEGFSAANTTYPDIPVSRLDIKPAAFKQIAQHPLDPVSKNFATCDAP
jgi:hypothetical protein